MDVRQNYFLKISCFFSECDKNLNLHYKKYNKIITVKKKNNFFNT